MCFKGSERVEKSLTVTFPLLEWPEEDSVLGQSPVDLLPGRWFPTQQEAGGGQGTALDVAGTSAGNWYVVAQLRTRLRLMPCIGVFPLTILPSGHDHGLVPGPRAHFVEGLHHHAVFGKLL